MASLIDHQDYTCAVCCEIYSERKPPKLLICGHAFCSLCLVECCRKQPFLCPACKNPQKLTKERVSSLSTVFSLLAIAKKAKASQEQSVKTKKPLCHNHKEPLESSCTDCNTNLCKICMREDLKRGKHKNHNVVSLADVLERKKSEIKRQQIRVRNAHARLLEQHTAKVIAFKNEIVSLKEKVNSDADQAVAEINKNRKRCLITIDTVYEGVLGNLKVDITKVHEELDSFQKEIATFLASIAETNISVDIKRKAKNIEKRLASFDSQMYLPKLSLSSGGSVKLRNVNVEQPPTSLVPAHPSTSPNMYCRYATHGSFLVRGAACTTVHLCCPGDRVRRLVGGMRPPPDAVVWGNIRLDRDPPEMPRTTETIRVGYGWEAAVKGIRRAEYNQRRAVAVVPGLSMMWSDVADDPITPLLLHLTTGRQHAANHIIVGHPRQDFMTAWQQQLAGDARMISLE